jgi:hypothetical protein
MVGVSLGLRRRDFEGSSLAAVISIYGVLTLTGRSSVLLGGIDVYD